MSNVIVKVETLKNYINGEWIESKTEQFENVYDPAKK